MNSEPMANTLPTLRTRTTKRLAAVELPSAFSEATVASARLAADRGASKQVRRRLNDKVAKLSATVSHGRWVRDGRFYGAFTRVTFTDGRFVEFSGRLTKGEALAQVSP
jgi:hypothetical protein